MTSTTRTRTTRTRTMTRAWLAAALGLMAWAATPALAQSADKGSAEAERASKEAAGDSATATGPGTEHHAEGAGPGHEAEGEEGDPSKHFNFFGLQPGHLF